MGRADAVFHRHYLIKSMITNWMWFSITASMNAAVVAAMAPIPEQAWIPIHAPGGVIPPC